MNFSSLTWRDLLSAGAALLSLTSSVLWLHDRWRESRDKRRRAAEHRRAAAAITPDADLNPDHDHDHDDPDHDDHDHDDHDDAGSTDDEPDAEHGEDEQP